MSTQMMNQKIADYFKPQPVVKAVVLTPSGPSSAPSTATAPSASSTSADVRCPAQTV